MNLRIASGSATAGHASVSIAALWSGIPIIKWQRPLQYIELLTQP